jgi:O-antigen/teichoic acid export membrane protein
MTTRPPEQSGGPEPTPATFSDAGGGPAAPRQPTFRNNVKWQFLGSAGQAVLGALVLLVMGRGMGAEGFGVFSIVFGIVYVANALGEPRMQDVAANQFWELHSGKEDADRSAEFFDLLKFEVMAKAIPCLGLLLIAGFVAAHNNLPADGAILLMTAAVGTYVSKLGFGLSMGLLRVAGRTNLFAFCAIADVGLRLVLMLAVTLTGTLSVLEAILIQSATAFVSTLLQWVFVYRQFPALLSKPSAHSASGYFTRIRHLRRLLLSNLALSASDLMSKDLDVAMMSFFMPASNIGIYKMAKNIAMLTWRAVDPFTLSLMPEINRLVAVHDYSRVRSLISKATGGLLALTLVMAVGTIAGAWLFGDLVFGAEYSGLAPLIGVMMLGLVVSGPLVWGHPLAVALGRADVAVTGSFTGAVLGLLAMILWAPRFGIYGASAAWALSFVSQFLYTAYASRRLFAKTEAIVGTTPAH